MRGRKREGEGGMEKEKGSEGGKLRKETIDSESHAIRATRAGS